MTKLIDTADLRDDPVLGGLHAFRQLSLFQALPQPVRSKRCEQEYWQAVAARLVKGREEYGERAFGFSLTRLADELGCEALDLAGWGYILHACARRLPGDVARVEIQGLAVKLAVLGQVASELVDEVHRTLALFESEDNAMVDAPPL